MLALTALFPGSRSHAGWDEEYTVVTVYVDVEKGSVRNLGAAAEASRAPSENATSSASTRAAIESVFLISPPYLECDGRPTREGFQELSGYIL
jgi:hypothetical protein